MRPHLLFVIAGSSGAGKSSLLSILRNIQSGVSVHVKDTTRLLRKDELSGNRDVNHVTELKKEDYAVIYYKCGNYYGVRKDQLDAAYRNKEIHFIIIRDINAIKQFKMSYPEARTIFVHSDEKDLPGRIKRRGKDSIKVVSMKECNEEYIENNTLFDHVIINHWDIDRAKKQLQNIVNHYLS